MTQAIQLTAFIAVKILCTFHKIKFPDFQRNLNPFLHMSFLMGYVRFEDHSRTYDTRDM